MNASLEDQLTALDIAVPPALGSRALAAAAQSPTRQPRRHRRRTALAGVGVVAAIAGANIAAAEYVPAYREFAQVLPFMDSAAEDKVRQSAGIPPSDFAPVGAAQGDQGFQVTVVGTYADEMRTTVLVKTSRDPSAPITLVPFPDPAEFELVDSSGQSLAWTSGTGFEDEDGYVTALDFGPLAGGPGASHEVTFRVTRLHAAYPPGQTSYTGNWEFPLTIAIVEAPSLPLPEGPLAVGGTLFTIKKLQVSGYLLKVEWEATGVAVDLLQTIADETAWPLEPGPDADAAIRKLMTARHHLWPWVIDAGGFWLGGSRSGYPLGPPSPYSEGVCFCDLTDGVYQEGQIITLPGPGEYTIKFRLPTGEDFDFGDQPGWPITIPE